MELVDFYSRFDAEFFYSFEKQSTDVEMEELGRRYSAWLGRNAAVVNAILSGQSGPDDLRREAKLELEHLAGAEAKFQKALPADVRGEYFESETGFNRIEGRLRGLVDGRVHLVRLVKPSEYDRNYWFYSQGNHQPQNVFCSEFGLDLVEYLKNVRVTNAEHLRILRKALAYQRHEVFQFWTLAPYVHDGFMGLGYSWTESMRTLLKIARTQFAHKGHPFAGSVRVQLGYDERMPSHLLARMESVRDVACLRTGVYAKEYGIAAPEG